MILSGFAADAIMTKTLATTQIGGGSTSGAAIAQILLAKTPITKGAALPMVVAMPDPFAPVPEAQLCPPGQLFSRSGCYTPSTEGGMPVPQQSSASCAAAGRVWDNDHSTCLPKAYTDALDAQAGGGMLDLGRFNDSKLPIMLGVAAAAAVGFAVWRSRRAAPMQGYRRRRRK